MYIDLSRQNIHENICWIFAEVTVKLQFHSTVLGKKIPAIIPILINMYYQWQRAKLNKKQIMKKPEEL